jgi:hypothetical protein
MGLTRKEAILAPFDFPVPDNLVEKVMVDRELKGDANYVLADKETVELCTADLCGLLVKYASEKEGEFATTFDTGKMKELRAEILNKYGEADTTTGAINAKSVW